MARPIRGAIAEHVVVATRVDPYLTLRAATEYTGLSKSVLLRATRWAPDRALPCYRVGNRVLLRRSELDAWLSSYREHGSPVVRKALARLGVPGFSEGKPAS